MLFEIAQGTGNAPWSANYQKSDDRNAFLTFGDGESSPQAASLQAVEKQVGPNAPSLLQHFQMNVSRSFPIIDPSTLAPSHRKSLHPALLCAVYTVAASSPGSSDKKRPLDVQALEDLALSLVNESLNKPTLSTIQAGLLLMQRSDIDSKTLNTQLVSATFELGLHLDCTSWQLSEEERGLRKRLAWAVYMQDVWCSLVHGRPSLISKAHWAVQDLEDEDFGPLEDSSEAAIEERRRGLECFCQMVALTQILSNILDTFYTQKAIQDYDDAGDNGTRLILERAKPIQMRLKEWFTELPKTLKLDNGQAPPIIGKLPPPVSITPLIVDRPPSSRLLRNRDNPPPLHHPLPVPPLLQLFFLSRRRWQPRCCARFKRRPLPPLHLPPRRQISPHLRHGLRQPPSFRPLDPLLVFSEQSQLRPRRHLRLPPPRHVALSRRGGLLPRQVGPVSLDT